MKSSILADGFVLRSSIVKTAALHASFITLSCGVDRYWLVSLCLIGSNRYDVGVVPKRGAIDCGVDPATRVSIWGAGESFAVLRLEMDVLVDPLLWAAPAALGVDVDCPPPPPIADAADATNAEFDPVN
jgi:hypothetical protein